MNSSLTSIWLDAWQNIAEHRISSQMAGPLITATCDSEMRDVTCHPDTPSIHQPSVHLSPRPSPPLSSLQLPTRVKTVMKRTLLEDGSKIPSRTEIQLKQSKVVVFN